MKWIAVAPALVTVAFVAASPWIAAGFASSERGEHGI